ncbi:MAG: lysine--tRNA ligase [Pseudomonadales bacterium]|nr:lysine--tRNA ligase [Pseudomonadales bacterium]
MSQESEIVRNRREKLTRIRAASDKNNPAFPNKFRRSALANVLHDEHSGSTKEALEAVPVEVSVAGRMMLRRDAGKASFITLQDTSGRLQCYVRKDVLGDEAFAAFKSAWDIGDIVGISGTLMRTNKGELTVRATSVQLLTKSLQPLPEKFHGLQDQEIRSRQRYLDLIMSEESRKLFRIRSAVIQSIREFFLARAYLEVETPMMQLIPGGATARPFVTHHNALDLELYLRVAPELNLKRLVVGGYERVFEINRNFRNEGLSTRHNPEFTMLEFYQAYSDYRDLITLTQDMIRHVCDAVLGTRIVEQDGITLDFSADFEELTVLESIQKFTEISAEELGEDSALREILRKRKVEVFEDWGLGRLQMEVFDEFVEGNLMKPTFITEYPTEVSPLSRKNDDNPHVTDRFELFAMGREIANGFSELNDPEDQAERFQAQIDMKARGDLEAMGYDHDYITALEYGLPPTAGEGIGIDRLIMLLTNTASIRDVILFPHMRPKESEA